jgi:hypothetical protein
VSKIVNTVSLTQAFSFDFSQSAQTSGSGSSQNLAFSSDVKVGDLLITCVDVYGQTITGISDSQGNTWTAIPSSPVQQDNVAPRYTAMYWAVAKVGGPNTVTVTFNSMTIGTTDLLVAAYTPGGGTVALDTSAVNSGSSITSLGATTGSVSGPTDLLVAFCSSFGGNNLPVGYTIREDEGTAATLYDAPASSSGTQSITVTFGSCKAGLILAAFSAIGSPSNLSFVG